MKSYIKYFQYFYLLIAILFLVDAFMKFQKGEVFWISLLLAGCAVFMFIFKRRFAQRYEDRNKKL